MATEEVPDGLFTPDGDVDVEDEVDASNEVAPSQEVSESATSETPAPVGGDVDAGSHDQSSDVEPEEHVARGYKRGPVTDADIESVGATSSSDRGRWFSRRPIFPETLVSNLKRYAILLASPEDEPYQT